MNFMKKEYIAPVTRDVKFSYTEFVCSVHTGSLDGIYPEQTPGGSNGDTGGRENPDDQASKFRGDNFYEGF